MTVMRSMLFLPATRPELIAKAIARRPDLAVLDLEDAVAEQHKDAARDLLATSTAQLADSPVLGLVRINAPGSDQFDRDLAAVADSSAAGVVLPKYEHRAVVDEVRAAIGQRRILIVGIESMAGLADCRALLQHDITAAYFGAEDYIADIGGRRRPDSLEVLHARSEVVLAARLAAISAIDQTVVSYRDDAAFVTDAQFGRDLGYNGKICIHPSQVPLANAAFSPSAEEVEHARIIVAAADLGVTTVDGQMVDMPHIRSARDILERAGA
jgi:citrate lyase subunit beta / citryl-CoA lyase